MPPLEGEQDPRGPIAQPGPSVSGQNVPQSLELTQVQHSGLTQPSGGPCHSTRHARASVIPWNGRVDEGVGESCSSISRNSELLGQCSPGPEGSSLPNAEVPHFPPQGNDRLITTSILNSKKTKQVYGLACSMGDLRVTSMHLKGTLSILRVNSSRAPAKHEALGLGMEGWPGAHR